MKINNALYFNIKPAPKQTKTEPKITNKIYSTPLKKDVCTFKGIHVELPNQSSTNITKAVKNAINHKNFLGSGSDGDVYKIPDTNYCVKVLNNETEFWGWTNKVSTQDEINHVVAKSDNGATIMNFITGKSLPFYDKPDEIYSLPIISYRKFIAQLTKARNAELECDPAPSNTIYNHKNKTLTQIDFNLPDKYFDAENNPLTNAYSILQQFSTNKELEKKQNHNLFFNLTQATLEELNPQNENLIHAKDINYTDFYHKYQRSVSPNILPKQYTFLNRTMEEIINLKYIYEKSHNIDEKQILMTKIKYAQSLINQLRNSS